VASLVAAHLKGIQQRLVEDEPLTGIEGGVNARDVVI